MNDKEIALNYAHQQLTGYAHAKKGYTLTDLICAMGLSREEWNILKDEFLLNLSEEEMNEIDEFLEAE